MNRRDLLILSSSTLAATALRSGPLSAQSKYPDHPIRLIEPYVPGGVVDAIGRLWADKMSSFLGTIVVENHSGAAGTIGTGEVARARPDGYTLLLGNTTTQVLLPAIMTTVPYDAEKDFAAVGFIANSATAICVNPSVPANNLPELIAYIKANPGKAFYGTAGTGSFANLAGEMLKQRAQMPDLVAVPYKGGGSVIKDLIGGQIPMMIVNITGYVLSLERAGKIRIVTVFSPRRVQLFPKVQAASETFPGLIAGLSMGVFAPAATPKPVLDRIAQAHHRVMDSDDFEQRLVAEGLEPVHDTPEQAQQFIDAERARIVPLVKALGFRLN
jgi:tripartite-type tricarboxylate transporter receptor subunit TctC